ncbi:hypothetical protein GGI12_006314, partial [Dipsacomyces acuminosporus]
MACEGTVNGAASMIHLDTCANITIVSLRLADKIGSSILREQDSKYRTVGHPKQRPAGKTNVDISIGGMGLSLEAY